jgi:hypothetical protein
MDCPFVNRTAIKLLKGGELQFHTQEEACLPFIGAVYIHGQPKQPFPQEP